ncbi:MAG: hypothetical protein RJB66_403 [Pseudomonadota bacterium]|jgi:MFS superfamily sulfate permease-like transporter
MKLVSNFFGAFGDAAILFPILVLLSSKAHVSMAPLLISTGFIYVFSALYYRVPMPVQPLKSVAMAAVAIGASFAEIRWAGAGIGFFCILLLFKGKKIDSILSKVPLILIHQLQVGLGVLLILQSVQSASKASLPPLEIALCFVFVSALLWRSEWRGVPLLGLSATIAFFIGLVNGTEGEVLGASVGVSQSDVRWGMVIGLILPQIFLTMGNSVLSTKIICDRLFPNQSSKLTFRQLLGVIGLGNLVVAAFGGMPFCHGSGGLTAHYRSGARHWSSTAFFGLLLIVLSFLISNTGVVIPAFLLVVLLATVGCFHVTLANQSWKEAGGRWYLFATVAVVLLTKNLLWVFLVFGIIHLLRHKEFHFDFIR